MNIVHVLLFISTAIVAARACNFMLGLEEKDLLIKQCSEVTKGCAMKCNAAAFVGLVDGDEDKLFKMVQNCSYPQRFVSLLMCYAEKSKEYADDDEECTKFTKGSDYCLEISGFNTKNCPAESKEYSDNINTCTEEIAKNKNVDKSLAPRYYVNCINKCAVEKMGLISGDDDTIKKLYGQCASADKYAQVFSCLHEKREEYTTDTEFCNMFGATHIHCFEKNGYIIEYCPKVGDQLEILKECHKELGGEDYKYDNPAYSRSCYLKCVFTKQGLLSGNQDDFDKAYGIGKCASIEPKLKLWTCMQEKSSEYTDDDNVCSKYENVYRQCLKDTQ